MDNITLSTDDVRALGAVAPGDAGVRILFVNAFGVGDQNGWTLIDAGLNGSAAGERSYPPPDPSVGGGLMARLARLYPRGPINVGRRVGDLPHDGTLPGLPARRFDEVARPVQGRYVEHPVRG